MENGAASAHCVICGNGSRGDATEYHMTHGIRVWLCQTHRQPRYLRRRRGRTFVEKLEAAWKAGGAVTLRRLQALTAHRKRMTPEPPTRRRPGSYAWPKLRETAEARFAAGHDPDVVIRELRALYEHYAARVPSVRTMRRWHAQGRWHHNPPASPQAAPFGLRRPAWLHRPRVSRWPNLGYDTSLAIHPLGWFLLLWVDDREPTTHWRRN